jgi:hypothetical protein
VHFGVSGVQNVVTLFFMLLGDQCGFHKKRIGKRYAELVFLHLMASMGHIVHIGVPGAHKVEALFFVLGWDQYRLYKNAMGHVIPNLCFSIRWDLWVTKCILVHPRLETLTHYVSCFGGPSAVFIKSASGNIMPNLCFCI